jgi:hypothetical protein
MSASQGEHATLLRELAALLIAVSGESVTVVKRSLPEQALKLHSQQEWKIYLEFLKVLFNMADRFAGFYLPLKDRPEFMDSLEDTVTQQLKAVLSPALGPDTDQMEVTVTIGQAVSESRQVYERHAFMLTEESRVKAEYLRLFGERVAEATQAPGNGLVISAATLCANAAIPAMKAAFEGGPHKQQTVDAAPAAIADPVGQ